MNTTYQLRCIRSKKGYAVIRETWQDRPANLGITAKTQELTEIVTLCDWYDTYESAMEFLDIWHQQTEMHTDLFLRVRSAVRTLITTGERLSVENDGGNKAAIEAAQSGYQGARSAYNATICELAKVLNIPFSDLEDKDIA